ncbi:hypothetical protein HY489_05720 [Candidatus Woesearchaeota archaeon]|nr:hypothetical protein [Candidatus Woesearchaeota archaeon]
MDKLTIVGRTNWEGGFYVKLKSEEKVMKIIKKIVEDLDSDYFVDNQVIPKAFSNYSKWKDQWIPIVQKNLRIDIICGDKMIHLIVHRYPSIEFVNTILDKYCNWAQVRYKKGLGQASK